MYFQHPSKHNQGGAANVTSAQEVYMRKTGRKIATSGVRESRKKSLSMWALDVSLFLAAALSLRTMLLETKVLNTFNAIAMYEPEVTTAAAAPTITATPLTIPTYKPPSPKPPAKPQYTRSKTNCPMPLTSEECSAHAKELGRQFVNEGAWGAGGNDRPKGCFVGVSNADNVFFNGGGDGYAGQIDYVEAICKSDYFGANRYAYNTLRNKNCPNSSSLNEKECQHFGKISYRQFHTYGPGNDRPKGCFHGPSEEHVFFNTGGESFDGAWAQFELSAVCRP